MPTEIVGSWTFKTVKLEENHMARYTSPTDDAIDFDGVHKSPEVHVEEQTVNYSNILPLMLPEKYQAVRVSYDPRPDKNQQKATYIFKTGILDLQVGEYVVVQTSTRWGLTVVRVEETDAEIDFESDLQLKWIVARIDMAHFDELRAIEERTIKALKDDAARQRREALRKRVLGMSGVRVLSLELGVDLGGGGEGEDTPSGGA